MAPNLADDGRHRVARELDAAVDVEAVHRLDQAERTDLDEVLERLTASRVAGGEGPDERHQLHERLLPRAFVAGSVVRDEESVDVAFHECGHLRDPGATSPCGRNVVAP